MQKQLKKVGSLQRILATVCSYKDLEPSLLGRMEELIDFVTAPGTR